MLVVGPAITNVEKSNRSCNFTQKRKIDTILVLKLCQRCTWQIFELHLQIVALQLPAAAPEFSKYVQFSFDVCPHPNVTEMM